MSLGKFITTLKVSQLVNDGDRVQTQGLAASKVLLLTTLLYFFPKRMLPLTVISKNHSYKKHTQNQGKTSFRKLIFK